MRRALLLLLLLPGCTHVARVQPLVNAQAALTPASTARDLPELNPLRGDVVPVHDPSLIRAADGSWIAYTTDLPFLHRTDTLVERCSPDLVAWHACGSVFPALPGWVRAGYPAATGLWAPEVAYFGGGYRLYYSVSSLGSQHSAIGMATNATLDPAGWRDQGPVLKSEKGGDFNAIDPAVTVAPDGHVWLTYGSFWGGIFQRELDPRTGKPVEGGPRWHLAQQPVRLNGAIEGASIAMHDGWYYLFASVGVCCTIPIEGDDYQEIVGRSRSIHGPFVAEDGGALLDGGGTVLLTSDAHWLAPGGGSVWQGPSGEPTLLSFHALRRAENGALYLWLLKVDWKNGWPVLGPL